MRGAATVLLLVAGFAYVAYKAEYLTMDGVEPWLRAFIVLPGVASLAAAGFVAFSDARRRVGACLLSLGTVAALACWLERQVSNGWTFYTPDSLTLDDGLRPAPTFVGLAALAMGLGAVTVFRRSIWGGLLLGLALWSLACFTPSSQQWARRMEGIGPEMPRRYRDDYSLSGTLPGPRGPVDLLLPSCLAMAGAFAIVREGRREKPQVLAGPEASTQT